MQIAVSYTHLDVYKRQPEYCRCSFSNVLACVVLIESLNTVVTKRKMCIRDSLTMSLCSRLHRWIHTVTSTLVLTHLTSVLYARLQRKSSLRSMKTCLAVTAVQRPMYIFHRFLTLLRVTTLQLSLIHISSVYPYA